MNSALQPVLFGAFDRHNLGDMLFAHLEPAWGGCTGAPIHAGIVAADLRAWGGHRVASLGEVLHRAPAQPLMLVHAGGEILSCDRWVARITTLAPAQAAQAIVRHARDAAARAAWLDGQPGFAAPAPYVVRRRDLPPGSRVAFRAVGGVGLGALDADLRRHVFEALAEAETVTVRDRATLATLAEQGIDAALEPDPAARLAERFGPRILERAAQVGAGHLALQASGEFADDASLVQLAGAVRVIAERHGLPVVLFRAGAAPWHDDIGMLRRLAARLEGLPVRVFDSLDIWDICALIAASRAVVASSLHARIVAEAFGRPAVSLLADDASPTGQAVKVAAYVGTWFEHAPKLARLPELSRVLAEAVRGEA